MKTVYGFQPTKRNNLKVQSRVRPSGLRLARSNNSMNNLVLKLGKSGSESHIAAHKLVQVASENNLRRILNHSILNENVEEILVKSWIAKLIEHGNINQMRQLLKSNYNLSPQNKRRLEGAVVRALLSRGTANEIRNFLNTHNLNRNHFLVLNNAWSVRRHNTPTLHRLIKHLTNEPPSKMSRSTIASLRAELNRRRLT
jgi:hypothetical protein